MRDEAARYHAAIAAAFPDLTVQAIRFLAEGWDSVVWEVNDDLVFRFPKRAEVAEWLRREIALLPALRPTLSVPAPQFTYVAEAPSTYPFLFVGYPKLTGEPLANTPGTSIKPDRLAAQIGTFLSALHRFPVAQAVACGVSDATPEEWQAQYVAMRDEIRTLYPRMTSAERERTERLFAVYFDNPAHLQFAPTLLHRDLGADHLLLDPRTADLAAVIDWGDISIGDPAQDFCGLPAAWLPTLLAHYDGAVDATFTERVAFYRALGPYHTLTFGLHAGSEPFITRGLQELRGLYTSEDSMLGGAHILARYQTSCCPVYSNFTMHDHGCLHNLVGSYTDESIANRLTLDDCIVAIHTVSDGVLEVRIHVVHLDGRPTEGFDKWDHVTEFSIDVASGHLVISDVIYYPPQELVISLYPGMHRVRVHHAETEAILAAMNDQLTVDNGEFAEEIWIAIWQEEYADSIVLKRYVEPAIEG